MQKPKYVFLHGIAADCRHTLKKFPIGGTKKDFGEKIIFCKMYVEIWAFDSISKCTLAIEWSDLKKIRNLSFCAKLLKSPNFKSSL